MLLDFLNAFNTVNSNLMLQLVTAHCPEMTTLTYWLYAQEPNLITARGDTLKSSTGTQQGCPLSNPLFALTMQYISQNIKDIDGLHVKQFFWDDTALVGTPEAVAKAARMIQDLSSKTGLKLNWKKCHLYGSVPVIENCNRMSNPGFSTEITSHNSFNIIYLKAPIGSDGFVT